MKILLCTPYIGTPNYVQGGLVVWSQNIINYHKEHLDDLEIVPISYDRSVKGRAATTKLSQTWYTFTEIGKSVVKTLYAIHKYNADFLHLCTSAGSSLKKDKIILKAARKKGIKTAVHFHFGRIPELFQKKDCEYNDLIKVLSMATVIITMDKKSYDCLVEAGYKNVKYLPNPISECVLSSIENHPLQKRIKRQLLFVGHVYKTKGVYELVEACKKIEGIELRIVGKVTDAVKTELFEIAGASSKSWLHFIGEVNHDEVINEFLRADMFVFPSYTEGFPNVILEAMACRIPIISSAVGAIPEMLLGDGSECGKLIEPQDSSQIYEAICELIDDDKHKKIMAENAFKRVNNAYSMPVVWKQLTTIWKE